MSLNDKTPIFVHIVHSNGTHLQWKSHQHTFQITKADSFDDLRTKLIKKLPKDQVHIIDCLKIKHKLKIIIDETATFNRKPLPQTYHNVKTEFYLHNNIFISIRNHKRYKIDIDTKQLCIWFIGSNKNVLKPSISNKNASKSIIKTDNTYALSEITSNKKQSRNKRKRNRNESASIVISNLNVQPLRIRKKRRINPECIWILVDMAPTMNTIIFEDTKKLECVQKLVQDMVSHTWKRSECAQNHMRLFIFSNRLNDLTDDPYMMYSETKASVLITKLKEQTINTAYEECISWKTALNDLLDVIIRYKYDKENADLCLDRNRIVLLTDAERGQSSMEMNILAQKLKKNKIVLDCIHVTQSRRCNKTLQDLCSADNIGKYWNPTNKSSGDYVSIMRSEFMIDTKLRNISRYNIIELD